jgi:hypothetical protein
MPTQRGRPNSPKDSGYPQQKATLSYVRARHLLEKHYSHVQGTFGNLGMYACSLPAGIVVDARGPRWGVAIGIVAFAFGYFPIYKGLQ